MIMGRILLRAKIHRAIVTSTNKEYFGSITIDEDILDVADITSFEQVHVVSISSGQRLITYAIPGKRGSGVICINGAAANLINPSEIIIILAYCDVPESEVKNVNPKIVFIDSVNVGNKILKIVYGHENLLNIT
jgi:aspartate 1-decarboxylase